MVIAKGIINITQGDNDFFDTPKTIHSVDCLLLYPLRKEVSFSLKQSKNVQRKRNRKIKHESLFRLCAMYYIYILKIAPGDEEL